MHIKNRLLTTMVLVFCSTMVSADLIREETSKSFAGYVSRVESLTYIASDNSLWQANDSKKTTSGQNPDIPEVLTQTMHNREIFYGASDLGTTSLNWRELETIASDGSNVLYVINTVNDKKRCAKIRDEPTIFKLQRTNGTGDFSIVDWHILPNSTVCKDRDMPLQSSYSGMVVINGQIYFSHKREIRLYNYKRQRFTSSIPDLTLTRDLPYIRDMAYDGTYLWILGYFKYGEYPGDHWITKVHWAERRVVESQQLKGFNIQAARGLAVNGNELYIGENLDTTKNIHVATILEPDNSLPPSETIIIISSDQLQIASTASQFPEKTFPRNCNADGHDSKNGIETCYISFNLSDVDLSAYSIVKLDLRVKNESKSIEIYAYPGAFDEDRITFNNAPQHDVDYIYKGQLSGERRFDISNILLQKGEDFIIEFYASSGDGMGIDPNSIKITLE